ncbi:MAG: hypothetical protein IPJ19_02745 [Planctomycetes bacterium]|nr:hypothetical protein [Planctomycetota bacterium]
MTTSFSSTVWFGPASTDGASLSRFTSMVTVSTVVFVPSVTEHWKPMVVLARPSGAVNVGERACASLERDPRSAHLRPGVGEGSPSGIAVAASVTTSFSSTVWFGPASTLGASLSRLTSMVTVSTVVFVPSDTLHWKVIAGSEAFGRREGRRGCRVAQRHARAADLAGVGQACVSDRLRWPRA